MTEIPQANFSDQPGETEAPPLDGDTHPDAGGEPEHEDAQPDDNPDEDETDVPDDVEPDTSDPETAEPTP